MVQILEQQNLGDILGQSLGSGLNQSLSAGMNALAQQMFTPQTKEPSIDDVNKTLLSMAKQFDFDLDPDTAMQLTQDSYELAAQGIPLSLATTAVLKNFSQEAEKEKPPTLMEGILETPKGLAKGLATGAAEPQRLIEQLGGLLGKGARGLIGEKGGGLIEELFKAGIPGAASTLLPTQEVLEKTGISERAKTPLGRGAQNVGELLGMGAISPASLFSRAGLWAVPAGLLGQVAEELGFGTTGKMVAELATLGYPALKEYLTSPKSQNLFKGILKKIGKEGGEVSPEALGRYYQQEAKAAGIGAEELRNPSASTRKKLDDLSKRIAKEKPSLLHEKISRTYSEEAKAADQARRAKILDEQGRYAKRTKRVGEEIAEERGRLEEVSKRERSKGEAVRARESQIKEFARKELSEAAKEVKDVKKSLGAAKDELSLAKKQKRPKEEIKKLHDQVKKLEATQELAEDSLKRYKYEASKGKEYKSPHDLKVYAENKAENVIEDLRTKSPKEVLKENKLDELAKEYGKRKTIPGQESLPPDTHVRIYDALEDAYKKKLGEVTRQLRGGITALPEKVEKELVEQRDLLQKLIKQAKGRKLVQRRRKGLQEMGKTLQREKKLKGVRAPDEATQLAKKILNIKDQEKAQQFFDTFKKESKKFKDFTGNLKKDAFIRRGIKIAKKLGLTPTPQRVLRWLTATGLLPGAGGYTAYSLIKKGARKARAQKAKNMSKKARILYLRDLKKRGFSTAEVNKIKRASQ